MNTMKSSYLHNFTKKFIISLDLHQGHVQNIKSIKENHNSNASHSIKHKDFQIFMKPLNLPKFKVILKKEKI